MITQYETLLYYDGPQIFTTKDNYGFWLWCDCGAVDADGNETHDPRDYDSFMFARVRVTQDQIDRIKSGVLAPGNVMHESEFIFSDLYDTKESKLRRTSVYSFMNKSEILPFLPEKWVML